MATADASLGPRYAPDDPTLPKPWKGLIDGSTGNLYYWNPETNVTQYEKPAVLPPPLPQGPPPTASPAGNGMLGQSGQQMIQNLQGLQGNQLQQQHGQPTSEQQGPHISSQFGPPGGYVQHQYMMPHQSQPMFSQTGPQVPQPLQQHSGQQVPPHQTGHQIHQEASQQVLLQPGQKLDQSQVHHFPHQQPHQMGYQQGFPIPKQEIPQQVQNKAHGQQFPGQQEYQAGFMKREEVEFSPSQSQQGGGSSAPNLTGGPNSVLTQMGAQSGPTQQFGSFQGNMQQRNPMAQFQQPGPGMGNQQQFPRFSNRMPPAVEQTQQPNMPPMGLRMGPEDSLHGRPGNDYYYNANKESPMLSSPLPKLAPIPAARNHPGMVGPGSMPFQNAPPGSTGDLNALTGHGMRNMYSHGSGPPSFANSDSMKSPYRGPSDGHLVSAEAYCQHHEVTATGDNIPQPFMTFEATGFPPEILKEVRYLLREEEHMSYAALLLAQ